MLYKCTYCVFTLYDRVIPVTACDFKESMLLILTLNASQSCIKLHFNFPLEKETKFMKKKRETNLF